MKAKSLQMQETMNIKIKSVNGFCTVVSEISSFITNSVWDCRRLEKEKGEWRRGGGGLPG